MSNAYQTGAIADAIIAAIKSAWYTTSGNSLTIQEDSEPRTIQDLWFVNLKALEIIDNPRGPNASVLSVDDLYRYEIILYFPMPPALGTSAGKVARLKATYAGTLRQYLQTGDGFGGSANLPYVTGVDFRDLSPRPEGSATLRVKFECHGQSPYFN